MPVMHGNTQRNEQRRSLKMSFAGEKGGLRCLYHIAKDSRHAWSLFGANMG